MTATSFDTLKVMRDLEAAGVERRQAEAHAAALRDAATADHTDLATKADVAACKADIAALRSEMRWMFGFLFALVLAIAARLFDIL